jgi:hypothetical protein
MRVIRLEHPEELEERIQMKGHRLRDPRREKMRDYRSAGHRFWVSGGGPCRKNGGQYTKKNVLQGIGRFHFRMRGMGDRVYHTGAQNFEQQMINRKMRRIPVVDLDGEGIIAPNPKTVDWLVW